MIWGKGAIGEEFVDAGVGERVCVDTDDEWDGGADSVFLAWEWFRQRLGRNSGLNHVAVLVEDVALGEAEWALVLARRYSGVFVCDFRELIKEDGDLDYFNVAICGIPVTMRVRYNETLARLAVLEKTNDGDVVARHDAVEDVVLRLHVRTVNGNVGVVNVSLVEKNVPGRATISACAYWRLHGPHTCYS